jgi:hypothetical protein
VPTTTGLSPVLLSNSYEPGLVPLRGDNLMNEMARHRRGDPEMAASEQETDY